MRSSTTMRSVVPVLLALTVASTAVGAAEVEIGDFHAVDRPAVALSGGRLYVAVAGGPSAPGIHLLTRSGTTWTHARVTTARDRQPSITVRDDGRVYIAFSRRGTGCAFTPCTKGIYVATGFGSTWDTVQAHAGTRDVHPSIDLDVLGRPWIYFRKANRIWELSRTGGSWHGGIVEHMGNGPDPLAGPELVVWTFSRIATFRAEYLGGRILLTLAEKDYIFTLPVTEADDAFDPDLIIDTNDDEWHVAYRRTGDGLWYARDTPSGVSNEQVTPLEAGPPSIAELPGGKVLIVASTAAGLIYRTNTTGTWTGGMLTSAPGDAWPAAATTSTGAAWVPFLRDGGGGDPTVWLDRHPAS